MPITNYELNFRDHETFAVFAFQQSVGRVGAVSGEFTGGFVVRQHVAQDDRRVFERQAVLPKQIAHVREELFPAAVGLAVQNVRVFLTVRLADLERDVREVAPRHDVIVQFHVGRLDGSVVGADRIEEVSLVLAARVAFELTDHFAVVRHGFSAAALAPVHATLAVHAVAASRAGALAGGFGVGAFRDVGKTDHHRDRAGVEPDEVDVRRFARVVVRDPRTAAEDPLRVRHLVEQDVIDRVVEDVDAPVTHLAGAGVPVPVPVVVEFVAEDRFVLRRAEPEIVIDFRRDRERRFPFADGGAAAVAVDRKRFDLAQSFFFVEEFFDFGLHRVTALLRADLADDVVFARGFHDLVAFPLAVREGFFDVNVLAGLHRPDARQAVPVVTRGNVNGVDGGIVEDFAHVAVADGTRYAGRGRCENIFVHVRECAEVHVAHLAVAVQMVAAAPADADPGDVDFFIGSNSGLNCGSGEQRGECSGGKRNADELTTIHGTHGFFPRGLGWGRKNKTNYDSL